MVPRLLAEERVSLPLPTLVRPPVPRMLPEKSTSLPAVLSRVAVTKVDERAKVIGASKRSWELALALTTSALAASPSEAFEVTAKEPRLSWTVPRKVLAPERRKSAVLSPATLVLRKSVESAWPPEITPAKSSCVPVPAAGLVLTREIVEGAAARTRLLARVARAGVTTCRAEERPRLTTEAAGREAALKTCNVPSLTLVAPA